MLFEGRDYEALHVWIVVDHQHRLGLRLRNRRRIGIGRRFRDRTVGLAEEQLSRSSRPGRSQIAAPPDWRAIP